MFESPDSCPAIYGHTDIHTGCTGWGKAQSAPHLRFDSEDCADNVPIPVSTASAHWTGKEKVLGRVQSLPSTLSTYIQCITPLPTCVPSAGSHIRTLTHVHTVPRPAAGQHTSPAHPNHPSPDSAASSPTPIRTPRGRTPAPGGRAAHEPLAGPRSGREGAAQGSDGHSGRPIEPSTASPKGGSGGSDGPNERGARVGLPPGIPLARIAGPWVTRKLGGRRRRQRLGNRVSDTGLQSPKPGRAAGPHPSPTVNAPRGGVAWSPGPFVEGAPPLLVATK